MFKLILPASEIPDDATITKIRGSTEYTLKSQIEIYGPQRQTIPATGGCRFLVREGNINAVNGDTELVWLCTADELYEFAVGHIPGYA